MLNFVAAPLQLPAPILQLNGSFKFLRSYSIVSFIKLSNQLKDLCKDEIKRCMRFGGITFY